MMSFLSQKQGVIDPLLRFISLIFISVMMVACTSNVYDVAYPTLSDGRYDSEFPYRSASKQLEHVSDTVKMMTTIAYYKSYVFEAESAVQPSNLTKDVLENKSSAYGYFNETKSGTVTTIFHEGRQVAVLTCAHIIDFPDTIITRFEESDIIQSVAIKEKQVNYVRDFPEGGELKILALNAEADIAILGRTFNRAIEGYFPVFEYPIGHAKELEWGTFVYVVGYPMGYQMITKGIVSSPNRDGKGSFLIDAPFNRGFSGGIVLAIRDGVPNFELVGMAKSVAADFENVLTPDRKDEYQTYDPYLPYEGKMYARSTAVIKYGITHVISVEMIQDFLDQHRSEFEAQGFYFRRFED